MATYCNITTDLFRAFQRVEDYKEQRTVRGWTVHSGSVYKKAGVGFGEMLFEGGAQMTAVAASTDVAAGKFYYDSDRDILYAQSSTGNMTTITATWGIDWDTVKTWAVAQASRDIDALLDGRFPRPVPESVDASATDKYDADLRLACAKIACSYLAARTEPKIFDPTPNTSAALELEGRKIIDEYNEATRHFSWEVTKDERDSVTVVPASGNTGDGLLQVMPMGVGYWDAFWKVKITVGGAVGTAKFQYSTDNGSTYNGTDLTTSRLWVEITGDAPGTGLIGNVTSFYVRFFDRDGAFDVNDNWQLQIVGTAQSSRGKMTTTEIIIQ